MKYATGYFGRPNHNGNSAKTSKVHVTTDDGKTLCGYKPHNTMKLQCCGMGIVFEYIECPKCKEKARKIISDNLKKEQEKLLL